MPRGMNIVVSGEPKAIARFLEDAHLLQNRFSITGVPEDNSIALTFTTSRVSPLVNVSRRVGVTISVRESSRISSYLGVSEGIYFIVLSLVGIIDLRTLNLNPLLSEEDLIYKCSKDCLLARPKRAHEYVLCLERPYICRGCLDFYKCLKADSEVKILLSLFNCLNYVYGESYSETVQTLLTHSEK